MASPVQPDQENNMSDQYDTRNKYIGTAVIICNVHFDDTALKHREVALKDVGALKIVLKKIGFRVKPYEDVTASEMLSILSAVAKEDHSKSDCFLCVLSSHGSFYGTQQNLFDLIYGKDGHFISIGVLTDAINPQKCPSLANKPKMFLLQSCRGDRYQMSVEVTENADGEVLGAKPVGSKVPQISEEMWPEEYNMPYELPIKKDYFLHFATIPGFVSFKKADVGTPFLNAWCTTLEEHMKDGSKDLLTLSTEVNQKVAEKYKSNAPSQKEMGGHERKQMPQAISMLTKDFYLKRKEPLPRDIPLGDLEDASKYL